MSVSNWLGWLLAVEIVFSAGAALGQAPGKPDGDRRQELIKKYDKDGDGRLSPQEWEAVRNDVREGKLDVPPQMRDRILRGPAPGAAPKPSGLPDSVILERDVEYGRAGDRSLKLDVVRPKQAGEAEKPLPAIVFIHGGGWRGGDKAGGVGQVARFVATGNYVGFSIGYRLSGEAIWPAQIHDCKAAIRWIKANAKKYHVDPDKIGVWGSSAGGHLVAMLGTSGDVKELEGANGTPDQSSRVACVVDFCGPADFLLGGKVEGGKEPSAATLLLGGKIEDKQDAARQASPITYVSKDDPPFLIVHGTVDATVPIAHSERLCEALKKAGCNATLVKIEGGGHGFGGPEVNARVTAFLEKHLRGQDVTDSGEPIQAPPQPKPRG